MEIILYSIVYWLFLSSQVFFFLCLPWITQSADLSVRSGQGLGIFCLIKEKITFILYDIDYVCLLGIWLIVNMQLSLSGNTWLIWSKSLAVTQKCLPDLYNSQKCINLLYKEMRDVQPNMASQLYFTIYFKSHNKMDA